MYRGLLRCAQCDLTITPERQKGFAYYHCTEYYGKHGAKWLREEKITEAIEAVFKQLQMPEDIAEQITAMLNEQHAHQAKFHSQHPARIEQEQKTLQKMKENLYIDKLKGRITEHDYDNFFKKFEEEQLNINHRLQKLQDADANYYITSAQIISLTSQAHDLFKRSEVQEKRHLIKFLLQNLQISGENVLYELKKPFDLLLNCSEEVRWRP